MKCNKYSEITDQIIQFSRKKQDIKGVIIIGSQVQEETPADEWSDLDLMLFTDDPDHYLKDDQWLTVVGEPIVCYVDETVLGFVDYNWTVKRVLFSGDRDVDFSILPINYVDSVLSVNREILSKGYRVIYDGIGFLDEKIKNTLMEDGRWDGSEINVSVTVYEALYLVVWAMKKIKRGELWVAVSTINYQIASLLLFLVEEYNKCYSDKPVLYGGRHLEMRSDVFILDKLKDCICRYDELDSVNCLENIIELIDYIGTRIETSQYVHDVKRINQIREIVQNLS